MQELQCKICASSKLNLYMHTARCEDCGVLLYWPPPSPEDPVLAAGGTKWVDHALRYYSRSSFFNHVNFTNMLRFTMDESYKGRPLDILDYGGGGGQFALVCKSHFVEATVYITDISDGALLEPWKPLNEQIPFQEFPADPRKFDVIFLNDVFEHVSDPQSVLALLSGKLKDGGKIFIDTPKQFWLYPATKLLAPKLYRKLLTGTVSTFHLQIWSRYSFDYVAKKAGLHTAKYAEISEYTMPPDYYLDNMKIQNPLMRVFGRLFCRNAKYLAKNKIVAVLSKENV